MKNEIQEVLIISNIIIILYDDCYVTSNDIPTSTPNRIGNTTHHHDNNVYVDVNCFSVLIIYAWLLSSKMVQEGIDHSLLRLSYNSFPYSLAASTNGIISEYFRNIFMKQNH